MKRKRLLPLYLLLALFTGCAVVASLSGFLDSTGYFNDPVKLLQRLMWPLMRITGFICIGLLAGQIIEGLGWTHRVAIAARPLMRWGRLSPQMGATFTTAFFSGVTSLSMLASFRQEGSMNRKEMTLAVLLNTFPSFFLHLPTTFFILIPLVGRAGIIYLLLTFGAALLRLGAVLTYTHFTFPESSAHFSEREYEEKAWREVLRETGEKFISRFGNILMIIIPVYVTIALISNMGFFFRLRSVLAHGIVDTFIPIEAMSIVIFSLVAEFTSGYAAAGAMLDAGTLNVSQTVLALIMGNIIAAPVRALRHQMPYYMGIFNPATGVPLMVASQAFRLGSLIVVGILFALSVRIFW